MEIDKLITREPFSTLFPIDPKIREALSESIRTSGFNAGFPIHVWDSEDEGYIVLDGHTRLEACKEVGLKDVPVHILNFSGDNAALKYACDAQRERRNLTKEEIRRFIITAVELLDNRRKKGGDRKSEEVKSIPPSGGIDIVDSAEEMASNLGVSKRQVERARTILNTGDKKLVEAVKFGGVSLNKGSTIALEQKKEKQQAVSKPTFNPVNDNIEWAKWSWNPVTGCKFGCDYCYARDIANRFIENKFEPTFYPERLAMPDNTKPSEMPGGNRVFVCSMADLFGDWVPNNWIFKILEKVQEHPEWTFIFLTKNPERLKTFEFPENAWVGTTVDCQARAYKAEEHMPEVRASVRFISCEPLLEEITFKDLSWCNWVIIGGKSKNSSGAEVQPEWSWVYKLTKAAYDANCKVYWKPNLTVRPKEHP